MKHLSTFRPLFPARLRDFPPAIDELFQQFSNAVHPAGDNWAPRVNISETPQAYIVKAEVPGIDPKDVEVTVTKDDISLKGEKKTEQLEQNESLYYSEQITGSFHRQFSFPSPVAADGAEALAENGVLTIKVPKAKEAQTHKVQVKTQ